MPNAPKQFRPAGTTKPAPYTDGRREAAHKFYNSAPWRKLRAWFLAVNPVCVKCKEQGRYAEATHVDHVLSRERRPDLELDQDNLMALCRSCHSTKTNSVDGGYGNPRRGNQ